MRPLSHYTSEYGLIGIVRSQSLWATDFLALRNKDETELTYALSALVGEAALLALTKIPSDLRDPNKGDDDMRSELAAHISAFKDQVANGDGYGSLYVTSFARGKTEEEDEHGIATHWERFTGNEGYCIQFTTDWIKGLIEDERTNHTHALIDLVEVKYGIDRESSEFKHLVRELSVRGLRQAYIATHDERLLSPDLDNTDVEPYFIQQLLSFCARHKRPCFADEREMRIIACPVNLNEPRVLSGIAWRKKIYRDGPQRDARRYIVLNESVLCTRPMVHRIIVGPQAKLTPPLLCDALYPPPPLIH